MSTKKATPTQATRQIIQGHVYDTLKEMPKRSAKRSKLVKSLAKRYKLATVTINKYFRCEAERLENEITFVEIPDTDVEYAPDTPPEGLSSAQEYVKAIGGISVDNFGHADPTWPWEGANLQIEQFEDNKVVIHMTVTISQEQMIETVLGLMNKSNIGFHSKLIG